MHLASNELWKCEHWIVNASILIAFARFSLLSTHSLSVQLMIACALVAKTSCSAVVPDSLAISTKITYVAFVGIFFLFFLHFADFAKASDIEHKFRCKEPQACQFDVHSERSSLTVRTNV